MRFLIVAAAAAIAVIGLAVALRLYMGRAAENRLGAGEAVAIADLRPPWPQNGFLVCPAGYCTAAGAGPAPAFDIDRDRLRRCWQRMLAAEPRVTLVASDPARYRAIFIQHTPLLRFPDIVTVEFVALAAGRSSLAIFSRARYGRRDFGTNRRRVERWLERLAAVARQGTC